MITAIYKSTKDERTISLPLIEKGGNFYLELEQNVRVPFVQHINDVNLGCILLTNDLTHEELIQDIHEKIVHLGSELDEFLDEDGRRTLFGSDFADAPESQVRKFSRHLNEQIAIRTGTEFEFGDIELDQLFSSNWQ